ncbi:MAG: MBL fold metallo-hydrolase [candidate division KSB1 bacterium]|nr:MBL fold metallo-hydrolase [candidate division KSB1 bacterium]
MIKGVYLVLWVCAVFQAQQPRPAPDVAAFVHWYGHASFRLQDGDSQIYIDPWKVPANAPLADIVLVTHSHFDHYAPATIARLVKGNTRLIAPPDVIAQAQKTRDLDALRQKRESLIPISPGDTVSIGGIQIVAVPAYNVGKEFHKRENRWVGYVVRLQRGEVVYHAGDTDFIPEMRGIHLDVALLPIGGTYTMGAEEAAKAVEAMRPRVVVPMHYGDIVGGPKDVELLRQRVGERVVALTVEK